MIDPHDPVPLLKLHITDTHLYFDQSCPTDIDQLIAWAEAWVPQVKEKRRLAEGPQLSKHHFTWPGASKHSCNHFAVVYFALAITTSGMAKCCRRTGVDGVAMMKV